MLDKRIAPTEHSLNTSTSSDTSIPTPAITVRDVSKMYALYADPRDRLKQSLWYALPQFLRGQARKFYHEFWALHDISFDVQKGETVGIIGQNGSGKSTLLQIIAGTLSPTHGEVQVHGRIAALLELGSGFNPEFTGRENVYLNGSILGLSQEEIDNIFDDIVAFADIGQFINQPVKLYSSGMFVRLAFAVQTFVPKEIFIVDEALAVGDEAFQRKCMVALERFRENGGTVLLVSHDTQTIVRQCDRCLLLSQGELVVDGDSKPVTDLYQKLMYSDHEEVTKTLLTLRQHGLKRALRSTDPQEKTEETVEDVEQLASLEAPHQGDEPDDWFDFNMPKPEETTYSDGTAEITAYGMYNARGKRVNVLVTGRRYTWRYVVKFHRDAHDVHFGMMIKAVNGVDIAGIATDRENISFDHISSQTVIEVNFSIRMNIVPGTYFLNAGVVGTVEQQRLYLHRRVDIEMIRVIPCDTSQPYGIAYLEPDIDYKELTGQLSKSRF